MRQSETVRKYDTYEDSGIEWIGKIPQNWNVRKLFGLLKSIGSGTTPKGNDSYYDGDIPWLNTGDLTDSYVNIIGKTVTDIAMTECSALKLFDKNSVVIAMYGATIGKLGIITFPTTTNQACCVMSCSKSLYNKYLFYVLYSARDYILTLSYGAGQPNISQETMKSFKLCCPDVVEQQKIADYLDKKCGEIDRVIETEKLVIEKLKEYKQSIITEAVTKGLDKSVPLKDSGIEWIGKIPQHWDVLSLARIANIVRGASPRPAGDPMYFCGNFCPWITVAEVTKDNSKYIFETEEYLTELGVQHSKLIDENTFLLSNSGATLGVPKITKIKGCINDGSLAFLDISCNMDYLYYVLKSRTNEFRKQMQGYGQPNLNTTIVKAFKICLPSTNEQIQIAEYLDKKCSEIDKAIEDKQQVIEKFTEYKKSLIYECVTGKRKVVA